MKAQGAMLNVGMRIRGLKAKRQGEVPPKENCEVHNFGGIKLGSHPRGAESSGRGSGREKAREGLCAMHGVVNLEFGVRLPAGQAESLELGVPKLRIAA